MYYYYTFDQFLNHGVRILSLQPYCLNLPARQLLLLRGICLKIETVLSTVVPNQMKKIV